MTRAAAASALSLLLSLQACGYALVGKGVTTDPSIRKIAVPLFRDATGRPGLDKKVTDKVIEELLKRGRFEVVHEPAGADALVEGELLRYEPTAVGVVTTASGDRTQANRYNLTLVARVKYTKTGAPEPIWQNERFTFSDVFDMDAVQAGFADKEGPAVDRLVTAFARSLVAAMLEAF